jgi:hypothetical protein
VYRRRDAYIAFHGSTRRCSEPITQARHHSLIVGRNYWERAKASADEKHGSKHYSHNIPTLPMRENHLYWECFVVHGGIRLLFAAKAVAVLGRIFSYLDEVSDVITISTLTNLTHTSHPKNTLGIHISTPSKYISFIRFPSLT